MRNRSFILQASMAILFVAGATAPTPLYAVYQRMWGFSPAMLTLVFAVYALAVLVALLVLGRLSDHVGRKPVLYGAALGQLAAMAMFAGADGVGTLLAARVVQGLATGAGIAAAGAGLLDLDRGRGTAVNAVAPMLGTAAGTLVAGLMAQFLPAPTLLVYLLFAAVFVVQAALLAAVPETVTPRPGAWASLRPSFALPAAVRKPMLVALPGLVAAWAMPGFYASLGPALVNHLLGRSSPALGGLALTVMASAGALAVVWARGRDARAVMAGGTAALMGGVAITLLAAVQGLVAPFFLGAIVAGAGFGATFHGAVHTIVPRAEAHERAGVLSVVYVVAYMAMGVPAILGGLRVTHGGGLLGTMVEFGVAVMVLAALALWGSRAPRVASVSF
ncbi:MAG: Permease of the major facilitator superfamily [Cyanobacteria bacterium RYN_339]|nr:Permease of the major facilitator superfamily [Cyanobacteria bacterium RYN_339]